ncbi:MAG: ABC transporter permease [Betaproteobacteria bacterium]
MTREVRRSRSSLALALGQVRYQLVVLLRSPLSFFVAVVIPLLLLVSLNVLIPGEPVAGLPYAQWLTPAMCAFCLLNACYVTSIISIVLAREEGILKRLRGTPLPAWTYLLGRAGSAAVTSVLACAVIIAIAVAFFDVRIIWAGMGYFVAALALGIVCFFLVGAALTILVPKSETALPIAFGSMLPLAFISGVFFEPSNPPGWLHYLSLAFPVQPVAKAMEDAFNPTNHGWPMPLPGLLVVLGWSLASIAAIAIAFRWEPGPSRITMGLPIPKNRRQWRRHGRSGDRATTTAGRAS